MLWDRIQQLFSSCSPEQPNPSPSLAWAGWLWCICSNGGLSPALPQLLTAPSQPPHSPTWVETQFPAIGKLHWGLKVGSSFKAAIIFCPSPPPLLPNLAPVQLHSTESCTHTAALERLEEEGERGEDRSSHSTGTASSSWLQHTLLLSPSTGETLQVCRLDSFTPQVLLSPALGE